MKYNNLIVKDFIRSKCSALPNGNIIWYAVFSIFRRTALKQRSCELDRDWSCINQKEPDHVRKSQQ